MIVDYHIHTSMCGHASGTMEELAEAAVSRGLSEIGIADHAPLLHMENRTLSMGREELPLYVERVLELKERFRDRLTIRLGIEADYYPATTGELGRLLKAHPFDYVIGSVHILDDWIFDSPLEVERYNNADMDKLFVGCVEVQQEMMATGLFDIVGHPDLAKKFGRRAGIDLTPYYRELLRTIKLAGACFEINTAGLRWPAQEVYPEFDFIRLGRKLEVPVTIGSDAHCPEDVGRDLPVALDLLRRAGYRQIAVFEGRAMRLIPLLERQEPHQDR